MIANAYYPLTPEEERLIAAGIMNPSHRKVRVRPIIEKPVRALSKFHPIQITNELSAHGYSVPRKVRNHVKAMKKALGMLPKPVLERVLICLQNKE
jgi:hypothetical protein